MASISDIKTRLLSHLKEEKRAGDNGKAFFEVRFPVKVAAVFCCRQAMVNNYITSGN